MPCEISCVMKSVSASRSSAAAIGWIGHQDSWKNPVLAMILTGLRAATSA